MSQDAAGPFSVNSSWATRWLGGFCAPAALGGLPVRGPDYAAHPPLDQTLQLPPAWGTDAEAQALAATTEAEVWGLWSAAVRHQPVVLARSVALARRAILQAVGVRAGEPITLPANANRPLVEACRASGAGLVFADLEADLSLAMGHPASRITWAQPVAGLSGRLPAPTDGLCLDLADSIPGDAPSPAEVTLYGLHLDPHPDQAGALIVCQATAVARAIAAALGPAGRADWRRAERQCWRLGALSRQQHQALAEAHGGLREASGLPVADLQPSLALAGGIGVQVPPECDPATFYAYVRAENTPVRWLPELRPRHYAARAHAATEAHLARWLLVPIGPGYSQTEIAHSLLGVVKAADYLGVRWYTQPQQAADYAALMTDWYGPDHDAYRPAFPLAGAAGAA